MPHSPLIRGLFAAALTLTLASGCAVERNRVQEQQASAAMDHFNTGQQHERAGDYALALDEYLRAMEVTERPAFVYRVGRTHRLLGNYDMAEHYLDRVILMSPNWNAPRAELQLVRIQRTEAEAALAAPAPIETELPEVAAVAEAELALAADAEELVGGADPQAEETLDAEGPLGETTSEEPAEVVQIQPVIHPGLSDAELLDPEEVRQAIFPELFGAAGVDTAAIANRRRDAAQATSEGRWLDAARLWGLVAQDDPADLDARLELARAFERSGRFRRAYEEFAEAHRLEPENVDVHLRWANALVAADDRAKAGAKLQETLRIEPNNPRVLNNLAALKLDASRNREAVKALEELVQQHPGFAPARLNYALALQRTKATPRRVAAELDNYLRLGGERTDEVQSWLANLGRE